MRKKAIRLIDQGYSINQISGIMGIKVPTLYLWCYDHMQGKGRQTLKQKVPYMREDLAKGMSRREIARKYNASYAYIVELLQG